MSLATHRAIEFAVGIIVALVPMVLLVADAIDATAAAVIVSGVLGIALITLGIAATREGDAVAPRNHAALDRVVIGALLVAGVAVAIAGDGVVGAICVGAGAVQMLITFSTRYDERRSDVSAGTTTTTT